MTHCDGIHYVELEEKLLDTTHIGQTANVSKNDSIFIGARQSLRPDAPDLHIITKLHVVLNGRALPDLQQYGCLGLTIKCNLRWEISIHIK